MMTDNTSLLERYELTEQIYSGSRTLVYRALRQADQQPVILKRLRNETPTLSELVQFRNQYVVAKLLDFPQIAQVYSLEPCGNGYVLVMEDSGGVSLAKFAQGQPLEITSFLAISVQLAEGMGRLHQHRVIHKDIKPANILIHPLTGQVKLIDFSIASLLPRQTQEIQTPHGLEGTLAYLSPEQTGRMNRGIDYRSDFYSLGITFYELLSGRLPFQSNDPMELIHCHLAKAAVPLHEVRPTIPLALSQIVAKLMAKNAEDRYQSALGLKHDLEICQVQWQTNGDIAPFALGERDVGDRFLIPEKLYGREAEVQTLLQAFDRVSQGSTELMLVAGFSGIGKTVVVNEVHKPIVRQRGYFIKGKYDQFQRNIPLSALVQAFRNLIGQLLAESDEELAHWRTQILKAVGENGQVIIDVIPELEQVLGQQSPVPELSGSASQNRFDLVFQEFVQVFTSQEHPLVIFLDDLQWADAASLKLLQLLMNDAGHLLILGAYRDNEVFPAHPLMLTVNSMVKAGARVNTLTLHPLSVGNINSLVADTLSCELNVAQPLTEWVYVKTQGNPFFTTQFLKALHQDGLITFDQSCGYWQCDIAQVRTLALTDDVVEFMATQLQKLSPNTQASLKLAACIGAQFDLHTLAIVSEKSSTEVATDLWLALQEGLISPVTEAYKFFQAKETTTATPIRSFSVSYKFLHDRIQQAAYSLIAPDLRQATHLKMGQLLLHSASASEREERLFEIVNHLNIGCSLLVSPSDREELVRLNLIAGRKAKAATAYEAAVDYLTTGIALLPEDAWNHHYDLTLALHTEVAESAYLNTDFEQMEQWAALVIRQARTLLDTIQVQQTRLMRAKAEGQLLDAIQLGLQVLQSLGVEFPDQPTQADIGQAFAATRQMWEGRSPLSLLDLPAMTDPNHLAAMQILSWLVPCAYWGNPALMPLLIFKQVELSIEHGNCSVSIYGYVDYGLILCGIIGDIPSGYDFGQLALKLLDQLQASPFKCRGWYVVYTYVQHWKTSLQDCIPRLQEAYQSGLETGDLESAGLNAAASCYYAYHAGQELTGLVDAIEAYRQTIIQLKQTTPQHYLEIYQQTVLNLLGRNEASDQLTGSVFDRDAALPLLQSTNHRTALFYLHFNQAVLSYLFSHNQQAAQASTLAEQHLDGGIGTFMVPLHSFYRSLIQLALYENSSDVERQAILDQVQHHQDKLRDWAALSPLNHQHRWELVEAERHRVLGNRAEALDRYDRAIASAHESGFIQDEAIANELAARFYLEWGKEKLAQEYLTNAYYGYARWGASAKVSELEHRYPQLLRVILQQQQTSFSAGETIVSLTTTIPPVGTSKSLTSAGHSVSTAFDLATVLKASQTLSSEIELEKLLTTLLQLVIANAGADKCAFVRLVDGHLIVEAITHVSADGAIVSHLPAVRLEDCSELPASLIWSARRSFEPIVIVDAGVHPLLATDPYVLQQQCRSVLCTQIVQQGKLLGLLYLENRLVTGAFTADRIEILNLLCAQAAISLENARLYHRIHEAWEDLQHKEAQYRGIFAAVSDGLSITDLETGKLLAANPAYCQLHGYSYEEILKLNPLDVITAGRCDKFATFLETVRSGKEFTCEAVCKTQDGTPFYLEIKSVPFWYDGKLCGLSVMRNVTDRKHMELSIQEKNHSLEKALSELQQAQMHMIQSEKMSALGNLVAGVAHEINNPVGFLKGNIQPALHYIQDLFGLLDLYQEKYPAPDSAIQDQIDTVDLEFIREDLPKLIASMQEGVDRIRNISTSLRTFSRADSDIPIPFNLHEGLDSTLLILKHRLKANQVRPEIQVMKQYRQIPLVKCFAGQLNQVFMNVLANAIDALDESCQGLSFEAIAAKPRQIVVATALSADQQSVVVRIQDNGTGIPEEMVTKIFDHLFTTKGVGRGTGLGLAIARQIVTEKHGGSLTVKSTLGHGSEFIITLSISGPASGCTVLETPEGDLAECNP